MAKQVETTPVAPAFREVLPIAPRAVTVDFISHTRKFLIVELDPALTLQDLNDHPEIWRLVLQDRNKAPAPNDEIELRGADWTCFAKVNSIDTDSVHLYDVRRASRPQRTVELFEDFSYRIARVGARFAVYSKTNGNLNPHGGWTFETIEQAKAFSLSQYTKRVVA